MPVCWNWQTRRTQNQLRRLPCQSPETLVDQGLLQFNFSDFLKTTSKTTSIFRESVFEQVFLKYTCRCDGIGRRVGLKIQFQQWSAGSSPATGTIPEPSNIKGSGTFLSFFEHRFSGCFCLQKRPPTDDPVRPTLRILLSGRKQPHDCIGGSNFG